ncbi:hypothetical protein ACFSCZ_18190 [Siminovitchia sediminis]|uniref:Uncharacterized protein n=1 Tax=Siminovitchia sediminis TaxID=1274353 RepID=A0ABW4KMX5_9BACI
MKVEFVQSAAIPDISKFQPDDSRPKLDQYTHPPVQMVRACVPRTGATTLSDQEIALAYQLNQKATAKNLQEPLWSARTLN